ncbi:MAG: glycosyltransferase family 39 protein [Richelia sp.]|nr:glycosyltransferase family 39 protein [Richelia sp.]
MTDDAHPPLYFVSLYYWTKLTGCSTTNIRLLSSVLSLLILPSSYLLAYEIFHSLEIALLATTLISGSPIFLIYAQEARHYGLLTFLGLLSSWILLPIQSDIKNTKLYPSYALVSTAGLYCHTLYYLGFAEKREKVVAVGISDQRNIFRCKKKRENSTKPMHNNTSIVTGIVGTYVQEIRANSNFSIKVPSAI